jgi:hypothetical protein
LPGRIGKKRELRRPEMGLPELSPFESIIKRKQAQVFADYSRNRNRCRSLQIVSMESLL